MLYVDQPGVKVSAGFPQMKVSLHLILIHIHVLEHFIQDHLIPWEFGGCKVSVANRSACLKTP